MLCVWAFVFFFIYTYVTQINSNIKLFCILMIINSSPHHIFQEMYVSLCFLFIFFFLLLYCLSCKATVSRNATLIMKRTLRSCILQTFYTRDRSKRSKKRMQKRVESMLFMISLFVFHINSKKNVENYSNWASFVSLNGDLSKNI